MISAVALVVAASVASASTSPPSTEPADPSEPPTSSTTTTTSPPPTSTIPAAAPPPADQLATATIALEPFADIPLLTAMANRVADGSMYFTSQPGEVWRVVSGAAPELVLDIKAEVSPYEEGSERGLLGIVFNPVDGRLFLYFTDANIDSHVVSYALDPAGRPDPASRWEVLFEDQPGLGHKGGGLAFTADGTLFVAFGDGGASDGRDAQDMSLVLGGVIRIVPKADGDGYDVPPDNPYVGRATAEPGSIRPEIWAKGLRNPWGFCLDPPTGDIWLGDVGNNTMEEIDRMPAGAAGLNFGWYYVEGTDVRHSGAPEGIVAPVHAYLHSDIGPAVIGGCVYRGSAIPALAGAYLFGDLSGPLFAIGADNAVVRLPVEVGGYLTGFGTGPDGELIVLTLLDGAMRIVPA